ncbi:MAG: hypothetical protein IJW86_04400 [Clostridia bacterium]|nr:hypothetical protein [Clostridia bacterium]
MKKLICLCMVSLTLLACLTACGSTESEEATTSDIKVIDFDTTRAEEPTTKIRQKKNYKITIPSDIISVDYDGDIQSYADTYGYEIVSQENGNVTFKMKGKEYSMLLSRVGMKTIRELGSIVDSGHFPYVKEIGDYSKDFSYILMLVSGKKYKKAEDKDIFMTLVSQCGLYYQCHANPDSPKCEVVIADSKSGEVLARETYTRQ